MGPEPMLPKDKADHKATLPAVKRRNTLHLTDATCPVCLAGFDEIEIDRFYVLPCSQGICGNCLPQVSFTRIHGSKFTDCPICGKQCETKSILNLKL